MAKLMEYELTFSDCSTSSNVVFFFMAKVIIIYLNVKNPGISGWEKAYFPECSFWTSIGAKLFGQ